MVLCWEWVVEVLGSGDDAGAWRQGCRFSVWDSRRQNAAVVAKVF